MSRVDVRGARVVVTGIGLVTPLGADRETSWRRLVAGERAGRWLSPRELDPGGAAGVAEAMSAAPFAGAPAVRSGPSKRGRSDDLVTELALSAAREALSDAGLGEDADRGRIGCVIGTSKGGLRSYARLARETVAAELLDHDPAGAVWQAFLPHAPATAVCAEFGLGGPLLSPVAACATGLVSLNRGFELVRDGACDVVLAGSSDASLVPAVLASFRRLGVLANASVRPGAACRPFDRDRDGFIVGEGAAVLVLERLGHAMERGAVLYAEWLAGGSATDPAGLTQLDPGAASLIRLIGETLERAELRPADIDYVNMHGTATVQNDLCETRALRAALGSAADRVSASSLKGAIGHLLGAAGSVEAACAVLAIREGVVPPTANLEHAAPGCDLDYTPQRARRRSVQAALKLSLGFGGHLAAAVIRRVH
jgi:3-oxoacyl-[acyl-carrier-protein] synthase II